MAAAGLRCLLLALCAGSVTASDWPVYGGDAGGRHYSSLDQIDRDNVDQLEVAWVFRSGDSAGFGDDAMAQTSTQSTPILLPEAAGGSLVYCTPFNRVIALDPGSGEQRWDFDPQINRGGDRPFRCRGVSYAEDPATAAGAHCRQRLFLATHDRQLWALDAQNGKPCAGFGDNGRIALHGSGNAAGEVSNASAAVVANGVVVTGSTVIDFTRATTPRGVVQAFDSHSGAPLWQFDPLLGHPDSGSANVWAPMSVDAEHGLVYLPTSAPSPDYYGVARPGDNLYANSVVALDLASGAVRWHFQHVRHDLWDYDTPAQPILFDWQHNGMRVPALAQLTKQGFVFVLNRLTGESLWEITEQPVPPSQVPGEVTALTQPKPIAPPPLLDGFLMPDDAWGLTPVDRAHCKRQLAALHNLGLFTPISETLTLMYPGSLGGANWGGGALLADQGVLLVNINNVAFTGRLLPAAGNTAERELPAAGKRFRVTMAGTPYAVEMESLQSFLGLPCNPPPWGKLLAVDLYGGRILWETALGSVHEMGPVSAPFHIEWGTPNLGGGIATAGGLFFIGATMDRQFRAFDTDNGSTLWRHTLPVDATATPMTYSYKGRQFVVINAGGHHMFNRGSGDYLYAFGLPQ